MNERQIQIIGEVKKVVTELFEKKGNPYQPGFMILVLAPGKPKGMKRKA